MENEILEVEFELGNGDKKSMSIQECEFWGDIKQGTTALIVLVNNEQMLVEINSACEDEGVSFKILGDKRSYHYESVVVSIIFVEV